ncbi:MAG: acetolactate decarboxylase [Thermomicrobiales bacterium]
MHVLSCTIREQLFQALKDRCTRTGESISEIVSAALAVELELEEAPLFQVSTVTALVEGVSGGVVSIGELKLRGDFGLGTFDGLDGEMVAFDGAFWQVRGDGVVRAASDEMLAPFAVVTEFQCERAFILERVASLDDLAAQLDQKRQTDNLFYAVRIDGVFDAMTTRSVTRTAPGTPLIEAAAGQTESDLAAVRGTLVGFWTPAYADTLNVEGWHLHFLSDDRAAGGHVLACTGADLRVQMQDLADVRLAMPQTQAFFEADLSQDASEELEAAERGRRSDDSDA